MLHRFPFHGIFPLASPIGVIAAIVMTVSLWAVPSGSPAGEFDSTGWRYVRDIHVPDTYSGGAAAVWLESDILEHCLPDLQDLRLISSADSLVPFTVTPQADAQGPEPIPVRVYRVARKAGKWTDIWVDKTAKVLTRGIRLPTRSTDFVRKVELRGADTPQEEFVIRMDGLIVDQGRPIPVRCDRIFHPLNNFQYLKIRVLDGDAPPLTIDGVSCYPPVPEKSTEQPLALRIIENRKDQSSDATIVVADLGVKRLPVSLVSVETPVGDFVKEVRISGGYDASEESWSELVKGTVYRITRDEASAENLEIRLKPAPVRYLKAAFIGPKHRDFTVSGISAQGSAQLIVFQPIAGSSYKLFYGNPSAEAVSHSAGPASVSPPDLIEMAQEIEIGPVRRNVPPPQPKIVTKEKESAPSVFGKALGVVMLLIGLLLLFSVMLKARSLRKREMQRNSRVLNIPR
ncbi:MAG: DUF3999 family protein [Pseudomonadota bacterium]